RLPAGGPGRGTAAPGLPAGLVLGRGGRRGRGHGGGGAAGVVERPGRPLRARRLQPRDGLGAEAVSRPTRLAVIGALAAAISACASEDRTTGIVVELSTDLAVPAAADHFRVRVLDSHDKELSNEVFAVSD